MLLLEKVAYKVMQRIIEEGEHSLQELYPAHLLHNEILVFYLKVSKDGLLGCGGHAVNQLAVTLTPSSIIAAKNLQSSFRETVFTIVKFGDND